MSTSKSMNAKIIERTLDAEVVAVKSSAIELDATTATDISLNLAVDDVVHYDKSGLDLNITLTNNEVVTIENFFANNNDGKKNRLFLSENEAIEYIDVSHLDPNVAAVSVTNASAVSSNSVVYSSGIIFGSSSALAGGGFALGPVAALGGAAAAAGGGLALSGDGDSGTSTSQALTFSVSPNDDGTLSASGTGEAGSTVTVTFPDGSTETVIVDGSGNFGPVISSAPQTSGVITAQQAGIGGAAETVTQDFIDTSAPITPVLENITANLEPANPAQPRQ